MFRFIGKLCALIAIGLIWGMILGTLFTPEIGVAFFLIFAVAFRKTVFEPISR